MRKNSSLLGLGLILFAVLACRTLQKISSRETLFQGSNMKEAASAFKEKIGGPINALSLEIARNKATLIAQDPKRPDQVNEYRYDQLICSGPYPVNIATLDPFQQNLEASLFPLDEVDLAATAQVVKAALERTNIESGKVSKIVIERGRSLANFTAGSSRQLPVRWHIEIQGPRESASATANAKGELVGVDLSGTSRATKQDYFDPQALEEAKKQIKQAFGGQVYLGTFDVSKQAILFQAATSATSDELHEYNYDLSGIKRSAVDKTTLHGLDGSKLKNHDLYFTLDEMDFGKTSQVLDTSFAKSGYAHPIITSMDFSRSRDIFTDRAKPIEWRVIVKDEENIMGGRATYVTFDAKGNFVSLYVIH